MNTSTTGTAFGIYGGSSSNNGLGIYGVAGNGTGIEGNGFWGVCGHSSYTGAGVGLYADETGTANSGYAVQAVNNSTSGWGIYSSGTSANYFAGPVGIGTNAPGTTFAGVGNSQTPSLQVVDGGQGFVLGGDGGNTGTLTNNNGKAARFAMPNYANAQLPVGLIVGFANNGNAQVMIGGGTSLVDAPTEIDFFTAAGSTTSGGIEQMIIDHNGNVNIINGNVAIDTASAPQAALDISNGGSGILMGGDNAAVTRTNNTTKIARIAVPQYVNANAGSTLIVGNNSSGNNDVYLGGGTSIYNAATGLHFMTAANETTVSGTERMTIINTGNVGIGITSPGSLLEVNGTTKLDSTTTINGTANFAGTINATRARERDSGGGIVYRAEREQPAGAFIGERRLGRQRPPLRHLGGNRQRQHRQRRQPGYMGVGDACDRHRADAHHILDDNRNGAELAGHGGSGDFDRQGAEHFRHDNRAGLWCLQLVERVSEHRLRGIFQQ